MRSRNKILLLAIMIITALAFFGCGDGSGDGQKKDRDTSSPAAVASPDGGNISGEAITTDSGAKKDSSEKSTSDPGNAESKKSSGTSSGSSKPNETKKEGTSGSGSSSSNTDKSPETIKCTISIDCKTLYAKDQDLAEKVSNKGVILSSKTITLDKGASVYDALKASGVSFRDGGGYITSINGLSEMDGGKSSGWMFKVNDTVVMKSCTRCILSDGDRVQWRYSCNSGGDI